MVCSALSSTRILRSFLIIHNSSLADEGVCWSKQACLTHLVGSPDDDVNLNAQADYAVVSLELYFLKRRSPTVNREAQCLSTT